MRITKVDETSAQLVGEIHSTAWKQAYEYMFTDDYILQDSPEKRKEECIDTLRNQKGSYYLMHSGNVSIGIIKVLIKGEVCEIESIYILKEYQNKGYGTRAVDFIKNEFFHKTIILWVLENNYSAIYFYKKNHFVFVGEEREILRGNEFTQLLFQYQNNC
jgi:ribosomal protein S18 acetylase RimI-like enzyme